ncbi:hypothetical protein KP509_36G023200 [Ceratopteris richardii]|uniref:Uncharacterized protein n=1 Tax=Ceratopteris richardii TaxID=49495 RepID=A0A8T2QAC9_CERRI|nr:hypothetical protein KP509_36G023200 [Ceratopteris richardii]
MGSHKSDTGADYQPESGTASTGPAGLERWNAAIANMGEIQNGIDMLQRLLLKQTIYKDEEAFAIASSNANQARHIMAQERRIRVLEKELDAAIASAGLARAEKRIAEIAQRTAETRTQEVLLELENTTQVFKLHMEELRAKQEELLNKNEQIKTLEAKVEELSATTSRTEG